MSFVEGKNYYEILGIERDASTEEIRAAYKEIARVYHPDSNYYSDLVDQNLTNSHLEIFQEITAAYNTLANKSKRVEYDKTLAPELRGWDANDVDEDQELLEALEKIGVDPESVGVTAKPKRKRKNSEAFGVFGTQIREGSSEASLGSIQAQYGVSGFRHGEDAFPKPKRPTLTGMIRPTVVEEKRPQDGGMKSREAVSSDPDARVKVLLMIFVGTGSICFAMSIVAFVMLR